MKYVAITLLLFSQLLSFSQTGLYNHTDGNIQIHDNGQIGFHTNLINDGTFDVNSGFTGFYSTTDVLTVSGDNRAIFNNVEIDVQNNLDLLTSMGVTNELLFLEGKVITPRNDLGVSLDFIQHDFYAGADNTAHTDGYATVTHIEEFIFPIGYEGKLRPMISPTQNKNIYLQGAYFYENPSTPNTFWDSSSSFDTDIKQFEIETVSTAEFWDLNGDATTQITLTWDTDSNISSISNELNKLTVVGWSIANNKWENLGNTNVTGDFDEGTVTSFTFVPNQYEIITIGSIGKINNNYNISPNGDGDTDFLVFTELNEGGYTHSELTIFNRWGTLVYSKKDYKGTFEGISTGRATILEKNKLPAGTYFYELKYGNDDNLSEFKTGWVYINR